MKKVFKFLEQFHEKVHLSKNESSDQAAKLHECPICHEIHY